MASEMTPRQRMLGVMQGTEHDRVPFVQYANIGDSDEQVRGERGADHVGLLKYCGVASRKTPNCRVDSERLVIDGKDAVRNTLHTPAGSLTEVLHLEPTLGCCSPRLRGNVDTKGPPPC